ncbi:putative phage tail tape measure protein (plasmid) [Phaeobacter piscinae]|uniref:phage tail tape measure protein n=1 Tax=Phaeobacter piscinae TaxID=1580596 RepID=UPI000C9B0A4B|nr:phage tail tape measure protein [Phaeobacter piscinae]AUR38349.1 putative phage tail tape measure protein [Phaeobacter piscinae]
MSLVGRLKATLGLDARGFDKGLKSSESRVKRFGKAISKIGVGLSVVSAGVLAAVRNQLNAADELSKSAQRLGVPIEELSALRHAADMSAVSASDLDNGLVRLSRNMQDAFAGGKRTSALFRDLGISFSDTNGKLRPTSEVMADAAERLAAMPDGAKKTALAFELFGRAGANLIPMLNGGRAGLQGMLKEARELGLVVDQKTGKSAENFNDNLSRLSKTLRGVLLQSMAALAPVLERITNAVVNASKWFRDLSPSVRQALAGFVAFLAVAGPLALAIGGVTLALSAIAGPVVAVVGGFAALVAGASVLGVSLRTIAAVAGAVAAAFGIKLVVAIGAKFVASAVAATRQALALEMALGAKSRAAAVAGVAVKSLSRALIALRSALVATGIGALVVAAGLLVDQFTHLVQRSGGLGTALSLLWNVAKEVFNRIGLAGLAAVDRLRAGFFDLQARSVRIWAGIIRTVTNAAEAIVDSGIGAAEAFKTAFQGIPQALGDFMFQAANSVIDGVEEMINAVVSRINKFISGLNSALAKLPSWAGGGSLSVGLVGEVRLGGVDNPFAGKAAGVGQAAQDAYDAAQGTSDFGGRTDRLEAVAAGIDTSAAAARAASDVFLDMATAPLTSIDALREAMQETEGDIDSTSEATTRLQQELDKLGDGGGGGAGKGKSGKSIKEKLSEPFKYLKEKVKGFSDSLAGAIVQGKSLGDAMRGVFQRMAQDLIASGIQRLMMSLFSFGGGGGKIFGSLLGSIFKVPSYASGTMNHPGGIAQVFEEGGELINLPSGARVIPHDLSRMMVTAAGKAAGASASSDLSKVQTQEVVVRLSQSAMRLSDDGKIVAEIGLQTDQKISRAAENADRALPRKVQQINHRPRDRYT